MGSWLACLACGSSSETELLQVSALEPHEVHPGDTVSVVGDGFALSKPSTVTLRGQVHRAGRESHSLHVALPATTESQHQLQLRIARELESQICGPPGEASHASFEGEVQVAIAAKARGAPPVIGTLRGARLEVYPAVKTPAAERRSLELGHRALSFFGLDVALAPEGGLLVVSTRAGGRASRAGLEPGDQVLQAAGVTTLQPSDLVPAPARRLGIVVLREGQELELELEADGFWPRPPLDLFWPSLLALCFAAACLLYASPLARPLSWLWARLGTTEPGASTSPRSPPGLAVAPLALGAVVAVAVGAALIAPELRGGSVEPLLGLLVACVATWLARVAVGLVREGRTAGGWSIARGLRGAVRRLVADSPGWVACLAVAFEQGFDSEALARAQGPLPWEWNAFHNPGLGAALFALLLTTLPSEAPQGRLTQADLRGARPRWAPSGVLGWAHACTLSALGAIAFLGGDALPDGVRHAAAALLPALAGVLLLAKYAALLALALWLRAVTPPWSFADWAGLTLRALFPATLAAAALAHFWPRLADAGALGGWLYDTAGAAAVTTVAAGVSLLAVRSLRRSKPDAAYAEVSPWL